MVVSCCRLARVLLTEQIYRAQEIRRLNFMEWCCWHVAVVDSGEALAIIVAILPPESSCVIQAIHFKHTLS